MIILLRGHIRNSFFDDNLYKLIKSLYKIDNNLKIYIHTWNIYSNSLSWRKINYDGTVVTETCINEYFSDLKHLIKKIIIDNDKNIKLNGNLQGKINNWRTPVLAWKNYWYGKFKLIEYVLNNEENNNNNIFINTRFDILSNYNSKSNLFNNIIDFINLNINNKDIKKNIFLDNSYPHYGIDNIYIGNINTMYLLAYHFHNSLDEILKNHKDVLISERIVYLENEKIFN